MLCLKDWRERKVEERRIVERRVEKNCYPPLCLDVFKINGPFGWNSGKVGEWKINRRMEKWEDRKDLVFPHVYLVGMVEKWEGVKLFV